MSATFYQTGYLPYGAGPDSRYQFSGILTVNNERVRVLTNGDTYITDGGNYETIPIPIDEVVEFTGSE